MLLSAQLCVRLESERCPIYWAVNNTPEANNLSPVSRLERKARDVFTDMFLAFRSFHKKLPRGSNNPI